ncbi:Hypothetical Protein SLY_0599 [Strawberry lethal yellows phytoplasma (CPA) str. NZSb11]|uniref:Uncharacterized protein n=1 Tax=Strawberry lethal yellows phytoplasma (CPA) str. NZSb11 TaxID=980422 RepID=R4S038_PHYAS|nr:Hypothetical Protein SLY_0189 [Strawberry lethal yellows phytoplasma (CPA) str. NZSb11]AGL90516.1 Hypothetical Protein SLY_0599 [Strawberry lethal yellows phytoplasma (CPA) str. NZSb11]
MVSFKNELIISTFFQLIKIKINYFRFLKKT